MAVMVDELRIWPHARPPFHRGSCHLTTDSHDDPAGLDELHAFAARLGLRRAWFQQHRLAPHYDLTPALRELALVHGAVVVSARQQARVRRALRNARGA